MAPPAATDSPFTAFPSGAGPDTSLMNSIVASLNSQVTGTRSTGVAATTTDAVADTSSTAGTGATSSNVTPGPTPTSTGTASKLSQTGTANVAASSSTGSPAQSHTTNNAANSATNAASTTTAGALSQQDTCNSISCSAGLKAAVAVPIVVGVLGLAALAVFFVRRKKRRERHEEQGLGKPTTNKKWTRHLRIFSFDAELLMGGRFSSTNSLRSDRSSTRGSTRSRPRDNHVDQPSLHSVDEVAPPYRDAISQAQPPNMTQTGHGVFSAGALTDPSRRPISTSTAPPPYVPQGQQRTSTPTTTASARRDPFADSTTVSPADDSPFNDPQDTDAESLTSRLMESRNPSLHHAAGGDDGSTIGGSEAASIHEAQVGRHVSVSSIGRTIDNFRSSQS